MAIVRYTDAPVQPAWLAALALSTALQASSAWGWGNLLLIERPPEAATVALGPSVWTLPAYPGARRSRSLLLPGLDYYAPSGLFASTDTGLGWNLSQRQDLQAGLRLWPQFGSQARDLPPGIAPIGDRLQVEAFVNRAVLPALLLQSGLLGGGGRHRNGAQLELGATSGLPLGTDLLGLGVAASLANRSWRQDYFGVSPLASKMSGLPATQMPAGWQDVSLNLSGEHRLGAHWRLDGQLTVARLLGAAAQSPLVQTRRQVGGTLAVWREL